MTITEYQNFESEVLTQIQYENKSCISTIENNRKLIEFYLNGKDLSYVKQFVYNINNIVLYPGFKKYKLLQTVLNHKSFTTVLKQFRESDVLIRACKLSKAVPQNYNQVGYSNKDLLKWLLKMGINYGVQDEEGKTALMYAVQNEELFFVVKEIMKTKGKHIHLTDNEGNNVLFHATATINTLDKFLKYKKMFDPNHLNNKNENIITYSCRCNRMKFAVEYLKTIAKYNCSEPNIINNDGMTALLYLVDHCYVNGVPAIIKDFIKEYKIDINEKNKYGNSVISIFTDSYYRFYTKHIVETQGFPLNYSYFKRYAITLQTLMKLGCKPSDEEAEALAVVVTKLKDDKTIKFLFDKHVVDMLIVKNSKKYEKYQEIDLSNPEIAENVKMVQKWFNEVYNSAGMVNTRTLGAMFGGYGQ